GPETTGRRVGLPAFGPGPRGEDRGELGEVLAGLPHVLVGLPPTSAGFEGPAGQFARPVPIRGPHPAHSVRRSKNDPREGARQGPRGGVHRPRGRWIRSMARRAATFVPNSEGAASGVASPPGG